MSNLERFEIDSLVAECKNMLLGISNYTEFCSVKNIMNHVAILGHDFAIENPNDGFSKDFEDFYKNITDIIRKGDIN